MNFLDSTDIRLESTDLDPFKDIGATLNGNSSIHMDLGDSERSIGSSSHLGWIVSEKEDFITDVVVLVASAAVFKGIVSISNGLAALVDSIEVDNDGEIEEHVAAEDSSSR